MMRFLAVFVFILAVSSLSCSTIPYEAPIELQEAYSMIHLNEINKVDKYLPKSNLRSKEMLKSSIDLWMQAKREQGGQRDLEINLAINEANKALDTAFKMDEIRERLATIDANESNLSIGLEKLETDADPVLIVEKPNPRNQKLVSTLAFFGFDDFRSPIIERQVFDSVLTILKENPQVEVTLTGYADELGSQPYNENIAHKRSLKVKNLFIEAGVSPDRIVAVSGRCNAARTDNNRPESFVFDRKVQAEINI